MRVTNRMLSDNFLSDMRTNLEGMQKLQQQMTSGKEIRKASDDPLKTSRAMQLSTAIDANKQYKDNISDTKNWLDTTDTALGQANNVMQRVRELLISSGSAAYGSSERKAIKDEINEKVGELSQVLNTNFNGSYIFGGSRGDVKPMDTKVDSNGNSALVYHKKDGTTMDPSDIAYSSDNEMNMIKQELSIDVSSGVKMEYSVSASDVLNYNPSNTTATRSLSALFKNIVSHLDGKDPDTGNPDPSATDKLNNEDLTGVTDAINNILKIRAEVGAKQNAIDSASDRNTTQTENMTTMLSKTEDIDITEKTMEYANAQTIYMASLQTSAKVIQPTLMDYLR